MQNELIQSRRHALQSSQQHLDRRRGCCVLQDRLSNMNLRKKMLLDVVVVVAVVVFIRCRIGGERLERCSMPAAVALAK